MLAVMLTNTADYESTLQLPYVREYIITEYKNL